MTEIAITARIPQARQVAVLILMHTDELRVERLILVRRIGENRWELPATRIARGESLQQAAARVAWFEVGVDISVDRIGAPICRRTTAQGVHLTSVRANLNADEFCRVSDRNPTGSHECVIIQKAEIEDFLPRRHDRQLLVPGRS